jgi:hypothetical protein
MRTKEDRLLDNQQWRGITKQVEMQIAENTVKIKQEFEKIDK